MTAMGNPGARRLGPEVRSALCRTYADLLRRQRTASTPFAKWARASRREHEFVWLGGALREEQLMSGPKALSVAPSDPLYEPLHKMYGTATLNPYEREILYGFPFVLGRLGTTTVRGPLLTLAVEIEAVGDHLEVGPADETLRFNSLPFRTEGETDARNAALGRILGQTPSFPMTTGSLRAFVGVLSRELPELEIDASLDGTLSAPPSEPRSAEPLRIIDQAAIFVAPKTNYFLCSDLDEIAAATGDNCGALVPLVAGPGDEAQVDITNEQIDSARIVFPFPSNRAQRRVALTVEDETTNVVCVEGPPGTGKSLTIANLACHLAATGKRVLITSQKDKALEVVDEKLRELGLAELPMTLLRRDKESKGELLGRLDRVEKRRTTDEVEAHYASLSGTLATESDEQLRDARAYAASIKWESEIEVADQAAKVAKGIGRMAARWKANAVLRRARRAASETTDVVAERAGERRDALVELALGVLRVGLERGVSGAKRSERVVVKELQAVLKRNQATYKNFSLFDRMKKDLDQAQKLLRILPVWILSPDDVARLFPCAPELFDVVIVDEASQVDLPSLVPMAYRAKKLVVFGDTKQMQSQRFAFMSGNLAVEAWQQFGMATYDPDERLHPVRTSLLNLVGVRAEESCLLDEHFRCLPPIIDFSNRRWYGGQLRIMTDVHHKRFGSPGQPVIELHHVEEGTISGGQKGQENELEAKVLVEHLARMVEDPDYDGASIGVLCLFEEQVGLINEMVAQDIDPAEWEDHSIVVVNPDGFQGDERDVILYSLSWDDDVMSRNALAQRQAATDQVQGMLNVAFTRARDEVHIFHSAPIESFGMAGDRPGALQDWLYHCASVQPDGGQRASARAGTVGSELEANVAGALRARGVDVRHQYPACGFSIDLVCELNGKRVAVECDGEIYHHDEHGNLGVDDLERQAVLERAGWRVLRIPYRNWRSQPDVEIGRILAGLRDLTDQEDGDEDEEETSASPPPAHAGNGPAQPVSAYEAAIVQALRGGHSHGEEDVLRAALVHIGRQKLGSKIREGLVGAAQQLVRKDMVGIEDGEYFLTAKGRSTELRIRFEPRPVRARSSRGRSYNSSYRRRSNTYRRR
jgi:very-short-patch-repair endonuclease/KaiC/GvpD/RAD55 family RecA-like ATPase